MRGGYSLGGDAAAASAAAALSDDVCGTIETTWHDGGAAVRSPLRDGGKLPFDQFCLDEALVRSWGRLEAAAALPMQGHAFASALSSTLLAGADIEVFFIPKGDDLAALLALSREPGYFARWTIIAPHVATPQPWPQRSAAQRWRGYLRDARARRWNAFGDLRSRRCARHVARAGLGRPAPPTPPSPGFKLNDPASRFNADPLRLRRAARRAAISAKCRSRYCPRGRRVRRLVRRGFAVELRSWKLEAVPPSPRPAKENAFRHFFRSAGEKAFDRLHADLTAWLSPCDGAEWQDRYWVQVGFDGVATLSPAPLDAHTIGGPDRESAPTSCSATSSRVRAIGP